MTGARDAASMLIATLKLRKTVFNQATPGTRQPAGGPLLADAGSNAINATVEQSLISKIRTLSPQQAAEVEDFVEFLAAKSRKRAAIDRLLAIAPALEAAGVEPVSEDQIAAEVSAARTARRARGADAASKGEGADRS